jgi:hypothetical protein
MMLIDMTNELSPILVGLNVALVVSGLGIAAHVAAESWSQLLGRFDRRPALARPVLVR